MGNYMVEYDCKSGWPNNIIKRLNISIGLYRRYYTYVKIGITCDPERRFEEHRKSRRYRWERMVAVYYTTSVSNANVIEKWFIENRPDLVNKWTGYSNMNEDSCYYAYILLGNHKKRTML